MTYPELFTENASPMLPSEKGNSSGFNLQSYYFRDSRKNSLELIELSSINEVSLVWVSSCSSTGSIGDDPYWTSRKNSLELIERSTINEVSLV